MWCHSKKMAQREHRNPYLEHCGFLNLQYILDGWRGVLAYRLRPRGVHRSKDPMTNACSLLAQCFENRAVRLHISFSKPAFVLISFQVATNLRRSAVRDFASSIALESDVLKGLLTKRAVVTDRLPAMEVVMTCKSQIRSHADPAQSLLRRSQDQISTLDRLPRKSRGTAFAYFYTR
jgi:hypothetical protein